MSDGRAAAGPVPPAAKPGEDPATDRRPPPPVTQPEGEVDGPRGPEPTRFGDWEKDGRCSDF